MSIKQRAKNTASGAAKGAIFAGAAPAAIMAGIAAGAPSSAVASNPAKAKQIIASLYRTPGGRRVLRGIMVGGAGIGAISGALRKASGHTKKASSFEYGFHDEIEKQAKYPVSRLLSSIPAHLFAGGALGGVNAAMIGKSVPMGKLIGGASQGAGATLGRVLNARALKGRIARGGKGLTGSEKKRLAEVVGVSVPRLEKIMKSMDTGKGVASMSTNSISRALNTKWTGLPILDRFVHSRGMAGRALDGGSGLLKSEKAIIDSLVNANRSRTAKQVGLAALLGGGAAAGIKAKKD